MSNVAKLVIVSIILLVAGIVVLQASSTTYYQTITEIEVSEDDALPFSREIAAKKGDVLSVRVEVYGGGDAHFFVRYQGTGNDILNGDGKLFEDQVTIPSDYVYEIGIWAGRVPPVTVNGTFSLKRITDNFYPYGYFGLGFLSLGLLTTGIALIVYYQTKKEIKMEMSSRLCPNCRKRVSIEKSTCPHCGFDISRSVQCDYCGTTYERNLSKCPNCGSPNRLQLNE